MPTYTKKTAEELAWEDARDALRAEVRRLTRRITDEGYDALDKMFKDANKAGTRIEVRPDIDQIKAAMLPQAKRVLGPGSKV